MEERYKSLAAMKPEPWIAHFKKTVGQPTLWSAKPHPVVIAQTKKSNESGSDAEPNMPLTVVSPIEQYSEMAEADMNETTHRTPKASVSSQTAKSKQQQKRKQNTPQQSAKKVKRAKDIFSRHGRQ